MNKDTAGSAFPTMAGSGMTLRDYFAAKAMQSIAMEWRNMSDVDIGDQAYCIADAMLKARKEGK